MPSLKSVVLGRGAFRDSSCAVFESDSLSQAMTE